MIINNSLKNIYGRSQPIPQEIIKDIDLFSNYLVRHQVYDSAYELISGNFYGCNIANLYEFPIDFTYLNSVYGENNLNLIAGRMPITIYCDAKMLSSGWYDVNGGYNINEKYITLNIWFDPRMISYVQNGFLNKEFFETEVSREISQVFYHEFIHFIRDIYNIDKSKKYNIVKDSDDFDVSYILHDYEKVEIEPVLSYIHKLTERLNDSLNGYRDDTALMIKSQLIGAISRYRHKRSKIVLLLRSKGLKENEINKMLNYILKRLYEIIDMIIDVDIKKEMVNFIKGK